MDSNLLFNPEKYYNPNHPENQTDVFETVTEFLDYGKPGDSLSFLHKLWQGYLRSQFDKEEVGADYDEYLMICQLVTRIGNLEKDPLFNPLSDQCVCRLRRKLTEAE